MNNRLVDIAYHMIAQQKEPFTVEQIRLLVESESSATIAPIAFQSRIWQAARDRLRREGLVLTVLRGTGLYYFGDWRTAFKQGRQFSRKGLLALARAVASHEIVAVSADTLHRDSAERSARAAETVLGALEAQSRKVPTQEPALGSKQK